jgi:glycosyltransferase involved in cell wall biosynthesis
MNPLVSVVTPVYNAAAFLEACAESIIRQTYRNWEYTIVDNCSSDGTAEIAQALAERDPRIRFVRNTVHVPAVGSFNRAFEAANPDSVYTKVVGADDSLHDRCLESMVGLAESSGVDVVGAYRQHDRGGVDLTGLEDDVTDGLSVLRRSLLGELHVIGSPSTLLLRTGLIRERDPFYDLGFRHADTEAGYWALTQSDFAQVREVLVFERHAGESVESSHLASFIPEHLRLFVRYGPRAFEPDDYRRLLRKQLRGYWLFLSRKRLFRRPLQPAFVEFHRDAIRKICREASGDPLVELWLDRCSRCLRSRDEIATRPTRALHGALSAGEA